MNATPLSFESVHKCVQFWDIIKSGQIRYPILPLYFIHNSYLYCCIFNTSIVAMATLRTNNKRVCRPDANVKTGCTQIPPARRSQHADNARALLDGRAWALRCGVRLRSRAVGRPLIQNGAELSNTRQQRRNDRSLENRP